MAEETKTILQALSAAVEMQKRVALAHSSSRFDRIDTELAKLVRYILKLREDQAAFQSDLIACLDSLARRMDDLENLLDTTSEDTRSARSEIVTLENEILNAAQTG